MSALSAVGAIRAVEGQLRQGRKFGPREVEDAVSRAYDTKPICPQRPKAKPAERFKKRVAVKATSIEDLEAMSPWDRPGLITAEMAIDLLFPGEHLLCLSAEVRKAVTAPRSHWLGKEHKQSFVVPNVARALEGKTADGRRSKRCNQMFPDRTYAVCEFDDGAPLSEQAGRALYLARILPLVVVCHSGNKSLHAWFLAAGEREEDVLSFYDVAISLGADQVGRTKCQMMRTPGAWRVLPGEFEEKSSAVLFCEGGIRQRIHYFDHFRAWTGQN